MLGFEMYLHKKGMNYFLFRKKVFPVVDNPLPHVPDIVVKLLSA